MLTLKIVSPEKIEFTGEVESVKVPGTRTLSTAPSYSTFSGETILNCNINSIINLTIYYMTI